MSKPDDVLEPLRNLGRWDYSQVYDSIDEDDGPDEWVALDDLRAAIAQVERLLTESRLVFTPHGAEISVAIDPAHVEAAYPGADVAGALLKEAFAVARAAGWEPHRIVACVELAPPPGGPKEGA